MEANKYQQGKIYKIISPHTDKIYIGSTTRKTLAQRLTGHRRDYQNYLADSTRYFSSFEILKLTDYRIVLVENYPCNSRDELLAREQHYMDLAGDTCVNMLKAFTGLTKGEYKAQYYNENKDKILNYTKQQYEQNKDKILEYNKNYREKIRMKFLKRASSIISKIKIRLLKIRSNTKENTMIKYTCENHRKYNVIVEL